MAFVFAGQELISLRIASLNDPFLTRMADAINGVTFGLNRLRIFNRMALLFNLAKTPGTEAAFDP